MSDFFKARLAATYTPQGGEEVALVRHNHLLADPPTLEWSLQTASYEYIAHTWAGDLPTGNARLTLAALPLIRANTRASLERKLRHLELQLNLHRTGTLLLEEAYSNGAPTLHTWWHAVVETANASPLPLDQAPPIPGAWGKLDLSIILTNPSLEDPLSRQSSEGAEEDDPNPNPENPDDPGSQDDPAARCTTWVLNVPDVYAAPWSTEANNLKEALLAIGLAEVQVGGATHDDPNENWSTWVCPQESSPAFTILVARFGAPGVTRDEVQAAVDSGYPWGVAILNPIIS